MSWCPIIPQALGVTASPTFAGLTMSGLTETRIPFAGVGGLLGDSADLTWDDSTKRLGINLGMAGKSSEKSMDISGDINFVPVTKPTALDMTLTEDEGAYNLEAGTYYYSVAYVTSEGDTDADWNPVGVLKAITITAANARVLISNIPVSSDSRVIARKLYRSSKDTTSTASNYLITTISDNTTTTFIDNIAQGDRDTSDRLYRKPNTTVKGLYVAGSLYATLGEWNSSFGHNALSSITTGNDNHALGRNAGNSLTYGSGNITIGSAAGASLTTASYNVVIGDAALLNCTGAQNVAVGQNTLRGETSGAPHAFHYNTAVGRQALLFLRVWNHYNTALGYHAGQRAQGSYNIFVGSEAGSFASVTTLGSRNIVIGTDCGKNLSTGNDNILIGRNLELQSPASNQQLSIGNLIFGTGVDGTEKTVATGKVGIKNIAPSADLDVTGDIAASGSLTLGATTLTEQNLIDLLGLL